MSSAYNDKYHMISLYFWFNNHYCHLDLKVTGKGEHSKEAIAQSSFCTQVYKICIHYTQKWLDTNILMVDLV